MDAESTGRAAASARVPAGRRYAACGGRPPHRPAAGRPRPPPSTAVHRTGPPPQRLRRPRFVNFLQATVLGIVQGLTEFLPISSSAHLLIVPRLLGWADPGAAFTAVIQLGTMAAVLIYFRQDIVRIVWTWLRSLRDKGLRADLDARMGWYIIWGTAPVSVFGLAFNHQIEGPARNLWLNASMLIVMGLLLMVAEWYGRQKREVADLNLRDGLVIGGFQALSL